MIVFADQSLRRGVNRALFEGEFMNSGNFIFGILILLASATTMASANTSHGLGGMNMDSVEDENDDSGSFGDFKAA